MTSIQKLSRLLPLVAVAACSSLTNVSSPDIVLPDKVANAAGAKLLYVGAVGSLALPYIYSGYYSDITDEMIVGFSSHTGIRDYSYILGTEGYDVGGYLSYGLHQSRVQSLIAIPAMQKYLNESTGPTRAQIGRLWSIVGHAELLIGETNCSGVPLGSSAPGAYTVGMPISRDSMLKVALAHLDSALAYSADTPRFLSLARVFKARALLNHDRVAEASALVAAVPTAFKMQLVFVYNSYVGGYN